MFRSAGKPLDFIPSPEDIVRFLEKVEVMDLPGTTSHGCWKWVAARQKKYEYGVFKIGGRCHRANRIAFQTFVGPLELGEDVHHVCRNQWCVNPRHLEALTHSENAADGNANRTLTTAAFLGGPLDGEEREFRAGGIPDQFTVRSFGQEHRYQYDAAAAEYVYAGQFRVLSRA